MLTVNKKFTIVRLLCAFAIAIALSVAVIFAVSEEPVTAMVAATPLLIKAASVPGTMHLKALSVFIVSMILICHDLFKIQDDHQLFSALGEYLRFT